MDCLGCKTGKDCSAQVAQVFLVFLLSFIVKIINSCVSKCAGNPIVNLCLGNSPILRFRVHTFTVTTVTKGGSY